MTTLSDLRVVGRITSPYGVSGWVKIFSYTEPLENIFTYDHWYVDEGKGKREVTVLEGKRHGSGLVAHLSGVDDREIARVICGRDIYVSATAFEPLPDGEYYWHQLEGLNVRTEAVLLGKVSHLLETGSNDVLVVRPCPGSLDGRERLIPYLLGQFVLKVDVSAGEILVNWDPEF